MEMMQVLNNIRSVSEYWVEGVRDKTNKSHKKPRPNTTNNKDFCLLLCMRNVTKDGIGMRKMAKSVMMFMDEDRYHVGSMGKQWSFIDGTIEAMGKQAKARIKI